ncbi:unnamed protein product [Adineta ricciae]|uniref:Uncharacterized protein n=1 Tax=Adineta ricciae TaxID=249248 RepID=A0A814B8S8_ADIRI|nr:unnamed protein product [Adineta ricciae]
MSIAVSCNNEMLVARIICEAMMIGLIALEPVKNPYLKVFVQRLLAVFILDELVIMTEGYILYTDTYAEWKAVFWRTHEIIRVFISLSLCYPMSLFIGENGQKVQRFFVVISGLVLIGGFFDHLQYRNGHSGMNHIAFMLIFLFTFYQYVQLRRQTRGEVPRLKSLMAIESMLIILNLILIALFLARGYEQKALPTIKITMTILQYHKFYMIISVMTYFE